VAQDWPVDGLEFPNSDGSRRYRLSRSTAGAPILLLSARATDPDSELRNIPVKVKKAIPVLALLALHAETRLDGLDTRWIYDVVWGEKGLDWRRRATKDTFNNNNVHQVISTLRGHVGEQTIETVEGGYRLTVPVHRATTTTATVLPVTPPTVEEPAPETPLSPAETRAEEHAQLVSSQVARLRSLTIPPYLRRTTVLSAFAGVFVWFVARHRPPWLPAVLGYGIVGIGIVLAELTWRNVARSRRNNKITIRVARLGAGEAGRKAQEYVMKSIKEVLVTDVVSIQRAPIDLSVAVDYEAQSKASALRFLKRQQCDVLIWGTMNSASQMKDQFDLRFSAAGFSPDPRATFELTQHFSLDATFGPELGTAVAAVAASMALPFKVQPGLFRTTVLEPVADQLSALVDGFGKAVGVDRAAVLQSYGLIQLTLGETSGDTKRLQAAIDALRQALTYLSQERVALTWAMTQNTLGLALMKLGVQQAGFERLFEAGIAFMSALKVWRGDDLRLERGAALHNLAIVQSQIGDREVGSESLEQAVDTFRRASETVQHDPRLKALVETSLAANLVRLGKRQKDKQHLREAIRLAEAASQTLSYALLPTALVVAQNALAVAFEALGDRENDPEMLEQAISVYRRLLRIVTRKRALLQWFNLQINLSGALIRRGEFDGNSTPWIREAVKVIEEALREPIRDGCPFDWASAQNALGVALFRIGEREDNVELVAKAEMAYRSALEEWTLQQAPSHWAMATNGLALALALLGAHQADRQKLEESISYFCDAAKVCTRDSDPPAWAYAQNGLAVALICLGMHETGTKSLDEAVTTLRAVLDEWTPEESSKIFTLTQTNLEQALAILRSRNGTAEA